jgi:integrase
MRNLRTIINVAIEDGAMKQENYPFGKRKYQIPANRNIKKALTLQDVKKIIDYTPKSPAEERARDMWVFSYLASGINMRDIALLQYKRVSKSSISFIREKTKRSSKQDLKPVLVPIVPEIKQIINKWGIKKKSPDTFVFGLIENGDDNERIDAKVRQATKTINKYTKRIGEDLGFEMPLTTYVARHTYATVMKRSGAPIELISESLGHKDLETTENYLDSFEDEMKLSYQKNLLDFSKLKNKE